MDILLTERLRLRWVREDDAPAILGLINEPPWIENIRDAGVRDEAQARTWIRERLIAPYWSQGHGFWAVERREDAAFLGICGLIHREGLPLPDLGYGLAQRYWGRGYAREAAAACLRYAQEVLGMEHLLATTAPQNEASGRLLLAIGFQDQGLQQTAAHEGPSQVYAWRAAQPSGSDEAQLDALVARFFSAFDNRGDRVATVAALAHWMLPGASVVAADAQGLHLMDLPGFLLPRAELLQGGRLRQFHERVVEQRGEIHGRIAQRWVRYEKRGILDQVAFSGAGTKTLQFARTDRGWKIAAIAWQDQP